MRVVSQIDEQFASAAVRNVKMRHGRRSTSVGNDGACAASLVDREVAAGTTGAVKAELDDKIGSVEARTVVKFGVHNVGYMSYSLRSGFWLELEVDGADDCINNKEVRHGCCSDLF